MNVSRYLWEGRAEYSDGTTYERYFTYDPERNESEQQFEIEEFLVGRKDGCTWWSVEILEVD